ncbi:MAG: Ig-like domain-containing protein [Patescibacteria group bacterium]
MVNQTLKVFLVLTLFLTTAISISEFSIFLQNTEGSAIGIQQFANVDFAQNNSPQILEPQVIETPSTVPEKNVGFGSAVAQVLGASTSLTDSQIQSIISLLQAFGADQSVITNTRIALGGTATSTVGTLTVTEDTAASLTYRLAQAGTTGVTFTRLKFHATGEAINVTQLALHLTNSASSSPADFVGNQVRLYKNDGVTLVGAVTFPGALRRASSTITDFLIPADSDAYMIVKGDLSQIGISQAGVQGHLIAVDYVNDGGNGNASTRGIGQMSGTYVYATSQSTRVASVRVFSSVPTIADVTTGNSLVSGGDLYKFSITAPAAIGSSGSSGVQLKKVTFRVATSSSLVEGFKLYGPSGAVNSVSTNTHHDYTGGPNVVEIVFDSTASDRIIGAGTAKTYSLRATNASVLGTGVGSASIQLLGDYAYPSLPNRFMGDFASINSAYWLNNFIWSPQATTTVVASDNDFTNGYGVPIAGSQATLTNNLPTHTFTYDNGGGSTVAAPSSLSVRTYQENVYPSGTRSSLKLTWLDNSTDESLFLVDRATSTPSFPGTWFVATSSPGAYLTKSFQDTHAVPGITYYYRVQAWKQICSPTCAFVYSGYSNTASGAVTASSLPDLAIQSYNISPTALIVGSPVSVTVIVQNQGTGVANNISVRVDLCPASPIGCPVGNYTISSLGAGQSTTVNFPSIYTPAISGQYDFDILIDSNNAIQESNESNNSVYQFLTVAPAPVVEDTTPPTVSITSPAPWSTYSAGQTVTVTATAFDAGDISKVVFSKSGSDVNTDYYAPYEFSMPITGLGQHAWFATAYDNNGNHTMAGPIYFNITAPVVEDTTPPTVSITSPAPWSTYIVGQTAVVTASVYDVSGISKVEFSDGGALKFTATTMPYEYSMPITSSTPLGQHAWFATAYDNNGNHAMAGPIYFNITAPVVMSSSSDYAASQVAGAYIEKPFSVMLTASRPDLGIVDATNSAVLPMAGSVTLSWNALGAIVCVIPGSNFGLLGSFGSRQTNTIYSTQLFTLLCSDGEQVASQEINIYVNK